MFVFIKKEKTRNENVIKWALKISILQKMTMKYRQSVDVDEYF